MIEPLAIRFSCGDLLWLKSHIILHDVVRCPRQLVSQRIMHKHEIGLLHLAIAVRPSLRIAASCALSRL
jgi:hypothetical protein